MYSIHCETHDKTFQIWNSGRRRTCLRLNVNADCKVWSQIKFTSEFRPEYGKNETQMLTSRPATSRRNQVWSTLCFLTPSGHIVLKPFTLTRNEKLIQCDTARRILSAFYSDVITFSGANLLGSIMQMGLFAFEDSIKSMKHSASQQTKWSNNPNIGIAD